MTSTTEPTVPLPTTTDTDDDDDDDDVGSSLLPSQPPAATLPAQPTVASAPAPSQTEIVIPGLSSAASVPTTAPVPASLSASGPASLSTSIRPSSATELADMLPNGSPTASSTAPANNGNGGSDGLSTGASAGIGIGVALIVCLAAFGMWFFWRRRKAQRTKTRSASSHSSDEEHAQKLSKPEVYAYRAGGPVELSGDEKPRRWNELESPTYVAEVGGEQVYRAELPGSVMPVAAATKGGDERLFADAPIDEVDEFFDVQERTADKKDERLFSDSPIDEGNGTLDTLNSETMPLEKKG